MFVSPGSYRRFACCWKHYNWEHLREGLWGNHSLLLLSISWAETKYPSLSQAALRPFLQQNKKHNKKQLPKHAAQPMHLRAEMARWAALCRDSKAKAVQPSLSRWDLVPLLIALIYTNVTWVSNVWYRDPHKPSDAEGWTVLRLIVFIQRAYYLPVMSWCIQFPDTR